MDQPEDHPALGGQNRMKEHLDAAERQKSSGEAVPTMGKLTFGEVTEILPAAIPGVGCEAKHEGVPGRRDQARFQILGRDC